MNLLTVYDVIMIHHRVIEAYGGSHGIRERGLLESAVAQPMQTFGGTELYPSLAEKVSAVGYSRIANHPFVDGNKRIGLAVIDVTLRLNHFRLNCTSSVAEETILNVACGKLNRNQLAEWVAANLVEFQP